jgi:hypothetical protein
MASTRSRAHDLEGQGDGHEGVALEGSANDVDAGFGQVGEVAHDLVLDLVGLPVRCELRVKGLAASFRLIAVLTITM